MLFLLWVALITPSQNASAALTTRFAHAVELQHQGNFAEAEAEYRAILKLNPDYPEAHANLGAVLMRLDRYQEAVESYQTALRLAPHLSPVLLNLGIAHYRKEDFSKAAESFRKFLEASPGQFQATQLLGLSLVELGRDQEALQYLEQARAAAPDDASTLYATGLAFLRLKRLGLDQIIRHLSQVEGGLPASHLLAGEDLLSRFEFERAAAELETAARLNSSLPRLQYSLGLAYFKLGRNRDALAAFSQEIARHPKDFSTLYYLANLHEAEGNLVAAQKEIDAALALDPDSAEASALLGKIRSKAGKPNEALPALESAVARDPNDPEKRYLLARAYQQAGRKEEASKQFAEVQRLKREQLEKDRRAMPKP
ncbi:MAG TPA: tetratricopeptide repeat protein [Acidobacteriota bacterium]|jgi:tetratricopeptide (TPR) repeat protein